MKIIIFIEAIAEDDKKDDESKKFLILEHPHGLLLIAITTSCTSTVTSGLQLQVHFYSYNY